MAHRRNRIRQGFTLIELLVVMAIIAVIAALLLVGIQKARASANKVSTVNNLRQLGIAFYSYISIKNQFPTESGASSSSTSSGTTGTTTVAVPVVATTASGTSTGTATGSFYTALLPYCEQKNAKPTTPIGGFLDPGRRDVSVGARRDFGYAASNAYDTQGPSILDNPTGVRQADITNGLDNTYLLTSVWMNPSDYSGGDPTDIGWSQKLNSRMYGGTVKQDSDPTGSIQYLGGPYSSTLPTLFADGHVEVIPYSNYPDRWSFQGAVASTSGSTPSSGSGSSSSSGSGTVAGSTGPLTTPSTPMSFSSSNPGYAVYYINGQEVPAFVYPNGVSMVQPGDTVQVVIYGDPYQAGQNYSGGGYTGAQAGWGNNLNQYTANTSITSSLSNNTNGQLTQAQQQSLDNTSATSLPGSGSTSSAGSAYGQGQIFSLVAYNATQSNGDIWAQTWAQGGTPQAIYSSDSAAVTGNGPITLTVHIPPGSLNYGSFQLDFVTGTAQTMPGYTNMGHWIDSVVQQNMPGS
jgi:prepilin-type N-terminal cleavage/methylation domain-containing protein/prepilin-type processing-associated H-X9-DG protein